MGREGRRELVSSFEWEAAVDSGWLRAWCAGPSLCRAGTSGTVGLPATSLMPGKAHLIGLAGVRGDQRSISCGQGRGCMPGTQPPAFACFQKREAGVRKPAAWGVEAEGPKAALVSTNDRPC